MKSPVFSAAELVAIEDGLITALVDNPDDDAGIRALAKVRNAMGVRPRATFAAVKEWMRDSRDIHLAT